jgi:GNAT superfamily N-acetyltransferase
MASAPVTVTYLEMRSPSALRPKRCSDPSFRVEEATVKQWQFNKFLYSLVGSDWRWTDKAKWSDMEWRAYAEADTLRTFAAYYRGSIAGYYELRSGPDSGVEIAIFGLAPKFVGRGFGAALLTHALETAWSFHPSRVWLHTCTLDHPAALPNYLARGMTIFQPSQQPEN